jgi:hypothetical protein
MWITFILPSKSIYDLVDVLVTETVLRAFFSTAFRRINHENAFARLRVLFIEHEDAGRNVSPVKEVCRQADDALEDTGADEMLAYDSLDIATEEHAMGEDARAFAVPFMLRIMCSR